MSTPTNSAKTSKVSKRWLEFLRRESAEFGHRVDELHDCEPQHLDEPVIVRVSLECFECCEHLVKGIYVHLQLGSFHRSSLDAGHDAS